ncbi:hypothetical protein [Aestuariivirga sp.]|uniref:hypothetical protein n=1 Tax=Aestuariivirga sp. TaxID=2650926 RepID=UPI0030187497
MQAIRRPLRRIAIVDDHPEEQYLYPEFILAREMLVRAGYDAVIASPESLQFIGTELLSEGRPVDPVCSRLVNFSLDQPDHDALCRADKAGAAAVTPDLRNHALFADKQCLVLLSNPEE